LVDVLQDTFNVVVDDDTYTFRIPTIRRRFEVGGRAADIRRRGYPAGQVNEQLGIVDNETWRFSRACAILELYLVKATVTWPFGTEDAMAIDPAKAPAIDFEKFPPNREDTVEAIGLAFEAELARFRAGGNPGDGSTGAKIVDGVGGARAS
jgi:hypothetical protein